MNDYARGVLRRKVLELRVELREENARRQEIQQRINDSIKAIDRIARDIADLQIAAGDAVEIDPQNPDIQICWARVGQ